MFVDENIERLIKQCDGGDEAMTFLAIYSFIEGYFRELYPNEFKWENDVKFPQIIDSIKRRHLNTAFPAESTLYDTLKKYHGERCPNAYKNLRTFTDTNHIRHCFSDIREGSLSVIVDQFIEFARYRGFLSEKISNMNDSKSVVDSRNKIQLKPIENSVLYHPINDLLLKYKDVSEYRNQKDVLESELLDIDNQILKEENEQKIRSLIASKKEKDNKLKEIDKKNASIQQYLDYINELAISLIEARSKKNYETQIIHLSEAQKKLIKEDIDALTTKDGHSMYIKGGPGTGKTLVLIVTLFKLYSAEHKSVLLTYYPTLNKYISYLFELYNDEKLLNYFNIPKLDPISLETLGSTGILKFDDFLLPKIRKLLNIKSTYSIKDNRDYLNTLFLSVEENPRKATKLYEEIIENVLPNMLDQEKYCTSQRKTERWEKISKILEKLDDDEKMLDLYAYYKFGLKNINRLALTNESFDYILIDEAQDLTNAQIFAVNKFVNKKGGLILAGDPSQEIRNKRITMAQLDVNVGGGKRYNPELTQNFRSSRLIQDLGNEYKQEPCLHIRKNTKSVEGITAGPPPQIFITDDTESSNYQNTYVQITNSVKMCIEDLCIVPENICIVAFNEPELLEIQNKLEKELNIKSALIYKDFSFKNKKKTEDSIGKVRLCTLREIKGIDCAVLLFMITDQSKQVNNGGFASELKANAIYTCITRAMYLLQVFVPKYCRMTDLSVAVLVNKLLPDDAEVENFVSEQNRKERKGIPLKIYFDQAKNESESEILRKVEIALKAIYEKKFGSDENCVVEYSEDSLLAYVYARKRVVTNVQDELTEISLSDALVLRPECFIDDEIEVYINPSDLAVNKTDEGQESDNRKEFIKILTDVYNQFPERRTDDVGEPLPNSNLGYLNIAGCGLSKPHNYGYDKWTELIKDNSDIFDYVTFRGKGTVTIFAFRPKNVQKAKTRDGVENDDNLSSSTVKLPTLEQIKHAIKKSKVEDNGFVLLKNTRAVIKEDFDITVSPDMLKVLVIQNPNDFELSKNSAGKNAVRIIGEKFDSYRTEYQTDSILSSNQDVKTYTGKVLGYCKHKKTGEYCLEIEANAYTDRFPWLPAYYAKNTNWRQFQVGQTITYKVEKDAFSSNPHDTMAIIV